MFKAKTFFFFLVVVVIAAGVESCTKQKEAELQPGKLLLISFDGFRYDYLNKTETPHFDSLAAGQRD